MITVNKTTFHSSYADANPLWKVIEKRGRGTWIAQVIDCPDYSGTKAAFTTEQIERSIGLSNLWNKLENEGDKFYGSLMVGDIVHYSNGFNQYVRCKVTPKHDLLPIALVGDWKPYDLPKRLNNGMIYNGYHVDKIKKGETMKPNASNIYEHQHDSRATDPRTLSPISLEVPEMTEDEKVKVVKMQRLEQLQDIVRQNISPDEIFSQVKALVWL